MLFMALCFDRPDSAALRDSCRPGHAAWIDSLGGAITLAGPMLNADGSSFGSALIIEAYDEATARRMLANDPFDRAGLFEQVIVKGFRVAIEHGQRISSHGGAPASGGHS